MNVVVRPLNLLVYGTTIGWWLCTVPVAMGQDRSAPASPNTPASPDTPASPNAASTPAEKPPMGDVSGGTVPAPSAGGLPWNRDPAAASGLPARLPNSARELLINVDESEWNHFRDGQAVDGSEEETLDRILYRLPSIQLDSVATLLRTDVSWDKLCEEPTRWRGEFLPLTGRVIGLSRVELLPEMASRLDFSHYHRVTIALDGTPHRAVVCTRHLPSAWLTADPSQERVSAKGLFLKVGEGDASSNQLVFVAHRVAWHPDRTVAGLKAGPDQVALGELGFDVGLLDEVRRTNFREITSADRECFYQMLSAVGRAQPAELIGKANTALSLVSLLGDPKPHHGQLSMVEGVARRVTKILVADRDIQQRFHIDHYYQIDLFILLGDQVIRMHTGDPTAGTEYSGAYPATVCVLRLPPGLSESANLREQIRLPAFFFKVWAYRSDYVKGKNEKLGQRSPMFLGVEPEVVPTPSTTNPVGYVAITTLVLVASLAWFGVFRWSSRRRESSAG